MYEWSPRTQEGKRRRRRRKNQLKWVERRRKEIGGASPALYKYVNERSFFSGSFHIFGHDPPPLFSTASHPSSHLPSASSLACHDQTLPSFVPIESNICYSVSLGSHVSDNT